MKKLSVVLLVLLSMFFVGCPVITPPETTTTTVGVTTTTVTVTTTTVPATTTTVAVTTTTVPATTTTVPVTTTTVPVTTTTTTLTPIALTFTTGMSASLVLGQADFDAALVQTPSSSSFSGSAYGTVTAVGGKYYFGDWNWSRVMVYNSMPTSNNRPADSVLGQDGFLENSGNRGGLVAANTLAGSNQVASDGTKFLINDNTNNRILVFNSVPSTYNATADYVIGQTTMSNGTVGTASNRIKNAEHFALGGGKLVVADSGNNRVLVYNSVPTSNGANPDLILGQELGTNDSANAGGSISAHAFSYPTAAWTDGTKLIVADGYNNRVLIWNTFPTTWNQDADVVVGQASLTTGSSGSSGANVLNYPYDITVAGNRLIVADYSNNRVLVFANIPTSHGASAEYVIGQPDFATASGGLAVDKLDSPASVRVIGTRMYVNDKDNYRYLVYNLLGD